MTKTVGYIVFSDNRLMEVSRDGDSVLYVGNTGTLFATRRLAARSIRITRTYAEKRGLDWGKVYDIRRLVAA